jgi:clan AA aspartic protease
VVETVAWIDTAFDGHLVFSHELIRQLQLESLAQTEAILADGRKVTLETFLCYVDWFGAWVPVQVIGNNGQFPLLGTGLLADRVLHVNYPEQRVVLE